VSLITLWESKKGHEFNGLEPKIPPFWLRIYKINNSKGPTFLLMVFDFQGRFIHPLNTEIESSFLFVKQFREPVDGFRNPKANHPNHLACKDKKTCK